MIRMLHNRLVLFLAPVLAWTLGGILLLALLANYVHADPVAGAWQPVTPAAPELGFEARLAAWSVAIYCILRAALEVIKVIAPLTPTKLDDQVRDALVRVLGGANPPADPPRPPPSTMAGMIGILVLGGALVLQPSCATVERVGAAGKRASLSCGKQYSPAIASTAARFGVQTLLDGFDEEKLESAALGAGLQVGGCAVFEFRRAWAELQKTQVAALGGEADPVTKIGAVLARLEAHWGVEYVE